MYVHGKDAEVCRVKQQAFWSDTLRNSEECGDPRRLVGEERNFAREEHCVTMPNDARETQNVEDKMNA